MAAVKRSNKPDTRRRTLVPVPGVLFWIDRAIGVQRFFRLNSVHIGFVALGWSDNPPLAAKRRCLPKMSDPKRKGFSCDKSKNAAMLSYCK